MKQPAAVADHPAALFDYPLLRLLPQCTTAAALRQAHAHLLTTGLALHTYPLSRLLLLLSSAAPSYAVAVLRASTRPTTFLYNILISAFSTSPDRHHLALSLYADLAAHPSLRPNSHTYPSLIRVCGPRRGLALHAHVLKFLADAQDHFVRAALVSFYSRCGRVDICRHLFDEISQPDLATWNAILSAYSHTYDCDDCSEALLLFHRMQLWLTRPNEITLVTVIGSCGVLGALGQGLWLHGYLLRTHHLVLNHLVGTALIDMYGKCGRLDLAVQLFDSLAVKDTLCYNAMICGLAVHGRSGPALKLFADMRRNAVGVDEVTFLVVISACAHAGLVEEGRRCFHEMQDVFRIEPKVEHYGCLVDLLGRAGFIKEAGEVVQKMPMRPNAAVYRALLAACRIHNKFEIGECVVRHLLQLEPGHGGNYVLLSNMYANVNRWDDVRRIRKLMKDRGVHKDLASSILEIDGETHEFVRGDKSHPRSGQIYALLDEMRRILHERGYRLSTDDVLFDV